MDLNIWALPSNITLEKIILPPKCAVFAGYQASAAPTGRGRGPQQHYTQAQSALSLATSATDQKLSMLSVERSDTKK